MHNKKNIFNLKVNDKISLLLVSIFVVLLCLFVNATHAKAVDLTPNVTNVDLGTATQKDNFDFSSAYNPNVKQNYIVSGNNEYDYWVIVDSTELDPPQHLKYNVLNISAQLPANNKYYRAVLLNQPTQLEGGSYYAGIHMPGPGWGSNSTYYGHINLNNQFISQLRTGGVGEHLYCYQCDSEDYNIPSICSSKTHTYCPTSELPAVGCNVQIIVGMDCQFLNETTSTVSEFVAGGTNQINIQITDNANTDLPGPTAKYSPFTILYFKLYKNSNGPTVNASVDTDCQTSGDNKIITLHIDSVTNASYYSILRDDNNDNVYEEVARRTIGSTDFLADYVDSGYNKNATVKYKIAAYNGQASTVKSLVSNPCSTPTPTPTLEICTDPVKLLNDPWVKPTERIISETDQCVSFTNDYWDNGRAKGIEIPNGWIVKIYEFAGCGGRSETFTTNVDLTKVSSYWNKWAYKSIYVSCDTIPVPDKPTLDVTSECLGVTDNFCHQKKDILKLSDYGNANIFYFYERKDPGWVGPIGPLRGPYAYSSDILVKDSNIKDTETRDFWGIACNTTGCSVMSNMVTSEALDCPCKPNITNFSVSGYCGEKTDDDYKDAKNTIQFTVWGPNWPSKTEIYRNGQLIVSCLAKASCNIESVFDPKPAPNSENKKYEDNKDRGLDPKIANTYYVRVYYNNESTDTKKITVSACSEVSKNITGVFIAKKIVDNTGDQEVKIIQDSHVINNPPPGFNDLFAPLWRELVP